MHGNMGFNGLTRQVGEGDGSLQESIGGGGANGWIGGRAVIQRPVPQSIR